MTGSFVGDDKRLDTKMEYVETALRNLLPQYLCHSRFKLQMLNCIEKEVSKMIDEVVTAKQTQTKSEDI